MGIYRGGDLGTHQHIAERGYLHRGIPAIQVGGGVRFSDADGLGFINGFFQGFTLFEETQDVSWCRN